MSEPDEYCVAFPCCLQGRDGKQTNGPQ